MEEIKNEQNYKQVLSRFQSLIALILLCVVISLLSDKFLTATNAWNVARQISVNVCISVGMTMVILAGGIDLSVGSVLALCGAMAAGLLKSGIEIPSANLYVGFTIIGITVVSIGVGL